MKIYTHCSSFNADTYAPVQLYLCLRDKFRKACLLESNDYHSRQNSKSFIGLDPIVEIKLINQVIQIDMGGETIEHILDANLNFAEQIQDKLNEFQFSTSELNGFFGRMGFEFNHHDETRLKDTNQHAELPLLHLFIFKYVISIDHFTSQGKLFENSFSKSYDVKTREALFNFKSFSNFPFQVQSEESAQYSNMEFEKLINKGISECKEGNVFQIVLSNSFEQNYFGDDFQVYRQLRRLNPSPYLFYFDFEDYRLFGSSPEAQLIIQNSIAEIHPIAGTVAKSGDEVKDSAQLNFLVKDEKENAEHTMLVDLARNDLSRDCTKVKVEKYKDIQHFSHVMHLVSKVTGTVKDGAYFKTLCHSFPAGTLSGTPKSKAMELIHQYENTSRGYYGGAIGMLAANGNVNMAIVIRSILSKNNTLHYRAGAGIVLDSKPSTELKEVDIKLKAIRTAINEAHIEFVKKDSDPYLDKKNSLITQ